MIIVIKIISNYLIKHLLCAMYSYSLFVYFNPSSKPIRKHYIIPILQMRNLELRVKQLCKGNSWDSNLGSLTLYTGPFWVGT